MFVIIASTLMLFCFLNISFAAEPAKSDAPVCTCFCRTEKGVKEQSTTIPEEQCRSTCSANGQVMAVCAFSFADLPGNEPKCWTQDQCNEAGGIFSNTQATNCPQGMRLCYTAAKPITLMVPLPIDGINSVTIVKDLADYIVKAYQFLLWIAFAFGVVMIMFGGLQYVLSSGSGEVENAKKRITTAVVGIALLLGSYLILYTVNPNLIKMQLPKMPMIKKVELIDNDWCEDLINNKKYKLGEDIIIESGGNEKCGTFGKVVSTPEGAMVADGTVCPFKTCGNNKQKCIVTPKAGPQCIKCSDINPDNSKLDEYGLSVSIQTCEKMQIGLLEDKGYGKDVYQRCVFARDLDIGGLSGLTSGTCAEIIIDCGNVTSCSHYDKVRAISGGDSARLDDLDTFEAWTVLEGVCSENICNNGSLGGKCYSMKYFDATLSKVSGAFGKNLPTQKALGFDCVNESYFLNQDSDNLLDRWGRKISKQ
ncbi:MAG: pilin [Patescibacteria group bacterium]